MSHENNIELFVPGRLCLFGEHSDWAGMNRMFNAHIAPGRAVVVGIEQGIYATAEKADDFSVNYLTDKSGEKPFCCPMDTDMLRAEAKKGSYDSYVAGVASYICENYSVGGVRLTVTRRDLPIKKGLSSSAAICVLVAQAFNRLYDLNLNTQGIMDIAYLGEKRTPSRCGRMDQACAFGVMPTLLEFDGGELRCERISVGKTLHFVFADLNAEKDTIKILAALNSAYPFPSGERQLKLHELLGEDNRKITARAVKYIQDGDAESLGSLMTEAQRIFDEKAAPLCPEQLTSPALHSVLADETAKALSLGGKGVGSQGDGSVQFLTKDSQTQQRLVAYLKSKGLEAYKLTLEPGGGHGK